MPNSGSKPKDLDDYLATVTPRERRALEALRLTIRAAALDATELISYGIPSYKHKGNLVSFAAFKNHLTFFAGAAVNERFDEELKGLERTKGGIHFTPEKPIPAALITRIVKWRIRENEARTLHKPLGVGREQQ